MTEAIKFPMTAGGNRCCYSRYCNPLKPCKGPYFNIVLVDSVGCTTATGNNITLSDTIDFNINYAPTDKELSAGTSATFGVIALGAPVSITGEY